MTASTLKPSKNPLGYTITFDARDLTFDNGSKTNEVVYNPSGQIVSGTYKIPQGLFPSWYQDADYTTPFELSDQGLLTHPLTSDITLYAKEKTFVLKKGSKFNSLIPSTATSVIFTDEPMPEDAILIDVDEDGDGGVVAWIDGTAMKISSQISGVPVYGNKNCNNMFCYCNNLTTLDVSSFDTSNVTDMDSMFNRGGWWQPIVRLMSDIRQTRNS